MTKPQWRNLRIGQKVWKEHLDLKWIDGKCVSEKVCLYGVTKKFNANCSQVLVKWDNTDNEIWYGRLGIEIV